jgi:transposase InsO family protein
VQWGLDQLGPLPKSSRGSHTYLLVVVDKFSKWIKAVPVTNHEATTAVKFFESIVYRYGVPNSIITDNGTNFTSGEFEEFAKELGIKIKYASVAHPKSNGQVEKANGLICAGLKKRLLRPLKRAAGAWVEKLSSVLWSLRTTSNASTGYTPFFLLFGAKTVLPTDVRYCAPRVVAYIEEDAQTALADAQDLLDEARDVTLARSAVYQQSLRNYHSRRVRGRSFEPSNLVLHLKQTSTSKLEPPWEGPYLVHEVIPGGAY